MAKRPKPSSSAPRAAQAADATVSVAGTVLRVLGTILLIVLVTGLLFLCIFAYYVKNCLSTDLDVQLSDFTVSLSSSILYEDSDGNWQNLTNLSSTENRVWIDYADIPKDMEHAAVAIEDKRFYKHKGVDWYRTTGAFINMFLSMKNDFGGSTITQQLIKNLTKQDDITVQRKLLEIFQALEFEKSYDKEEIMEWYLNIVYFGEGCNGVYTAAETYFGKEPKDLTLAECASIIGITNNPSKYDPFISRENNKARQETILKQMYEQGYINKEQYDEAVAQELVFVRSESDDATQTIYSYYAEAVRWALSEGIATGTTGNTFSPDSECTRAQAVAFLFRYAASEAVTLQELVSGFSDADSVPGYALPAMNWALAEEIVQGNGSKLMPNDSCTRAQIVTFLFRAYQGK